MLIYAYGLQTETIYRDNWLTITFKNASFALNFWENGERKYKCWTIIISGMKIIWVI